MTEATVYFVATLLFAHWVGDFVCQFNWLAANKAKNNLALSLHVLIWSLWVTAAMAIFHQDTTKLLAFWVMNFVLHYWTDFFTSRLNGYLNGKGWRHAFFTSIGFDQWIHAVTLLATAQYLFPLRG